MEIINTRTLLVTKLYIQKLKWNVKKRKLKELHLWSNITVDHQTAIKWTLSKDISNFVAFSNWEFHACTKGNHYPVSIQRIIFKLQSFGPLQSKSKCMFTNTKEQNWMIHDWFTGLQMNHVPHYVSSNIQHTMKGTVQSITYCWIANKVYTKQV